MIHLTDLWLTRIGACIGAGMLWIASTTAAAQTRVPLPNDKVAAIVTGAMERWSARQRMLLSPGLYAEASSGLFAAVVASCYGTAAQCDSANDAKEIAGAVTRYLNDLLTNPLAIELPGDRLLARTGFDKAALGWASGPAVNRYLVSDLPAGFSELAHIDWNGSRVLSKNVQRLLLPQGVDGFVGIEQTSDRPVVLRLLARRDPNGTPMRQWVSESAASRSQGVPWRTEPERSRFCLDKPVDPTEPKYRLSTGRGSSPIGAASDFHSAEAIRIVLQADDAQCDAACRGWVGMSILQSLAQWRSGCTRCPKTTLTIVEVGSATYVATSYVDSALQLAYIQSPQAAARLLPPGRTDMVLLPSGGAGFQRVDGIERTLGLCSTAPSFAQDAGFSVLSERARSRICEPAARGACTKSDGCLEMRIRLSGATDCTHALACGFPDQSVTLNTPKFRFSLIGPDVSRPPVVTIGSVTIQQGDIPLHPVLLHEVGHWFGIPHVESDPAEDGRDEVMVDTGGTDRVCISRGAFNMVDSAVDRNWPLRQNGRGALRYAPHR